MQHFDQRPHWGSTDPYLIFSHQGRLLNHVWWDGGMCCLWRVCIFHQKMHFYLINLFNFNSHQFLASFRRWRTGPSLWWAVCCRRRNQTRWEVLWSPFRRAQPSPHLPRRTCWWTPTQTFDITRSTWKKGDEKLHKMRFPFPRDGIISKGFSD